MKKRFLYALFFLCLVGIPFIRLEKRVLLIAPTEYEQTMVQQFPYTCYFYPLPNLLSGHHDLSSMIDAICTYAKEHKIDGIISSDDYAGAAFVSICSKKLGLVGPSPLSVLTCQHKYYSRLAQKESVSEATPLFSLGPHVPFPCFVKPVKSFFSIFSQKADIKEAIKMPNPCFFDFFDQLIAYATPFEQSNERILAEELLQGVQVTWEGFVCDGQVETIGIVDSVMHPGTISFERFEYPSKLAPAVQMRMEVIAKKFISYVGLDNTMCNIEFMYDKENDRLCIVEVNPRIALQFCDLYEKVDGTNSYEIALALATGTKPKLQKNQGKFCVAASFVLRRFENCIVRKVPTEKEILDVCARFADACIIVDYKEGQKLSELLQDGISYRYALIHLGANDEEELFCHYEECRKALPFTFEKIS